LSMRADAGSAQNLAGAGPHIITDASKFEEYRVMSSPPATFAGFRPPLRSDARQHQVTAHVDD